MEKSEIDAALCEAEVISSLLLEEGVECVVIGAIALAVHRYIRYTQEVDLKEVGETCRKYRICGWAKVMEELG